MKSKYGLLDHMSRMLIVSPFYLCYPLTPDPPALTPDPPIDPPALTPDPPSDPLPLTPDPPSDPPPVTPEPPALTPEPPVLTPDPPALNLNLNHNSRLIRQIEQNKIYKKFRDLIRD